VNLFHFMRSDFHHTVGESSKSGRHCIPHPVRKLKRVVLDDHLEPIDSTTTQKVSLRHGFGYDRVQSSIRLRLVARYLQSRVGQDWNQVFSEFCQQHNADSPLQYRIRAELLDSVHVKTCRGLDGRVYEGDLWKPCDTTRDFFLEPETGLLRQSTHRTR